MVLKAIGAQPGWNTAAFTRGTAMPSEWVVTVRLPMPLSPFRLALKFSVAQCPMRLIDLKFLWAVSLTLFVAMLPRRLMNRPGVCVEPPLRGIRNSVRAGLLRWSRVPGKAVLISLKLVLSVVCMFFLKLLVSELLRLQMLPTLLMYMCPRGVLFGIKLRTLLC